MSEDLAPGWYTGENGRRYWTGAEWVVPQTSAVDAGSKRGHVDAGADAASAPSGAEDAAAGQNSPDTAESAPGPSAPVATKQSRKGLVIALVAAAAVITGGTGAFLLVKSHDRESLAIAACEDALADSLKNPAAAVFHDSQTRNRLEEAETVVAQLRLEAAAHGTEWSEETEKLATDYLADAEAGVAADKESGSRTFYVFGEVDAQNGFGATTRETWKCAVVHNGERLETPVVLEFGDEFSLVETLSDLQHAG